MATVGKDAPSQVSPSSLSEDESWKRSTDCIYFLASPLTCKKGKECEFRHSEAARNNPVDCWYWLNGKCSLNVSCAFRHPPLEGVPSQAGNYVGPSPPIPRSAQPFISTPHNANKQATPCVFFQMGCCTKGGMCNYLHGPIHPPNPMTKPGTTTTSTTEAPTFKKTFGGSEKVPHSKMGFHPNPTKVVETPRQPQSNVAPRAVEARPMERRPTMKHYQPPAVAAPPANNGSLRSKAARPYHASSVDDLNHQNGRDADESLRESSPGFDVLVDDKLEEDEYYDNEDQYVRVRGHEGRSSNELDMGLHDDYNSSTRVGREDYRNKRGYDTYNDSRDKYAREQRGTSSEILTTHDRRGPYKPENSLIQNSSDLRHRLSKQRRDDGLRSVISPDYKPSHHSEDRGYRSSRRDARSPLHETSVASRLQGRIKLPRRSPPVSGGSNMYSERDDESGRYVGGRLSPSRPKLSSLQGRLRGRLGVRIEEENKESKSVRGPMRKDSALQPNNGDAFSAPKRLSEVRGTKHTDIKHQHLVSGGKLRDTVLADSLRTESGISFDGPKPLSEILKRKRKAGNTASTGVENKDGQKQTENDVNLNADTGKEVALSSAPERRHSDVQENNEALIAEGDDEEEAEIPNKKAKSTVVEEDVFGGDREEPVVNEEFIQGDGEEPAVDEEFNQGDGEDAEVDEEFDQGDGEYDYEQDEDVEGYNLNEGDVVDNEEFMDEDDGDDFAKKLGVSF